MRSGYLSFLARPRDPRASNVANLASTGSSTAASSHHRRRSSNNFRNPPKIPTSLDTPSSSQSSGTHPSRFAQSLDPVPGTPGRLDDHMSLSRSPSPQRSGGWSSPGLTTPYNSNSRRSSPIRSYANGSANNVTWATAQARSDQVRSFSPKNQGFSRHFQNLSAKLPYFNSRDYSDKEKLGRGRWSSSAGSRFHNILAFLGRVIWRMRLRFAPVLAFLLLIILFYATRKYLYSRIPERSTNKLKLYIACTGGNPSLEEERSLSLCWLPTKGVGSWSGRVQENGQSKETASRTSKHTRRGGVTNWKSWT